MNRHDADSSIDHHTAAYPYDGGRDDGELAVSRLGDGIRVGPVGQTPLEPDAAPPVSPVDQNCSREPSRSDVAGLDAGVEQSSRRSPYPANGASAATVEAMHEFYAVPFLEPEGGTTWAVREFVYGPDSYLRQIVSWHPTREEAQEEVDRRYGR